MKRILMIDNYDSFTFNLVQYVSELNQSEPEVVKNDQINLEELKNYDGIILSPGPGLPFESGQLMQVFAHAENVPLLGVCLGHQAIAEFFGAKLLQLDQVYHGIDSMLKKEIDDYKLFDTLPNEFQAGRYHSWVIDESSMDDCPLKVTCRDKNGIVMGVVHTEKQIHGVQFHPESVMTLQGRQIISNFLEILN